MADIRTATLNIPNNTATSPVTVSLSGTALSAAPSVTLNPPSLAFSTAYNTTSSSQSVTITNNGTADLVVSTVTLTGTDAANFIITSDGASGQTITPGTNRTIAVEFAPNAIRNFNAFLTINDNAVGTPHSVALQGVGTSVTVNPVQKSVYATFYLSYGLSSSEGFGGETYQGWGGTFPAPRGTGNSHTFAPPSSIAADFFPADYWSGATGYPASVYSSSSSTVLLAQCKAAIQAGINVLIVSWSPPTDRSNSLISTLLTAAQTAQSQTGKPLSISFMIEPYGAANFTDPVTSTVVNVGRSATTLWHAVNYINSTYGSHPNFFKTNRTGMNFAGSSNGVNIFFLNRPDIDNVISNTSITPSGTYWQTSTDNIHNIAQVPGQGLIIANKFQASDLNTQHFDGGFSNFAMPSDTDTFQYVRAYQLSFPPSAIAIPMVSPGYSAWREQAIPPVRNVRNAGALYTKQFNEAMNVSGWDIGIDSFNNWGLGTQIEPAAKAGTP